MQWGKSGSLVCAFNIQVERESSGDWLLSRALERRSPTQIIVSRCSCTRRIYSVIFVLLMLANWPSWMAGILVSLSSCLLDQTAHRAYPSLTSYLYWYVTKCEFGKVHIGNHVALFLDLYGRCSKISDIYRGKGKITLPNGKRDSSSFSSPICNIYDMCI